MRTNALMFLPVAAVFGLYGWLGWDRRWMSEDAFINLRVINNLLDGHGPVYNIGERVEAYTSPLWVALQTGAALVSGSVPLERVTVALGLACALIGVATAAVGSYLLAERRAIPLPLGLLILVGLPPFWEFATSGLETGLTFAWLGGCLMALALVARYAERTDATALEPRIYRGLWWTVVLTGLGPVIRPDFALFSISFFLAAVVIGRASRLRAMLRLVLVAAALPLSYQVVRMGVFASVVPNTALAKEAFKANWTQGLRYGMDLIKPYHTWIPLLLLLGVTLRYLVSALRGHRERAVVFAAVVSGALAHALYVVRIGGDFMHGRFFLPAIFALLMPVAVVAVNRRLVFSIIAVGVMIAWTVPSALWWRVQYEGPIGPHGIADERLFYALATGINRPIRIERFEGAWFYTIGRIAKSRLEKDRVLLVPHSAGSDEMHALPLSRQIPQDVALLWANIGIAGYVAGSSVYLADPLGLADPIASRLQVSQRGRPGHEKALPMAWMAARLSESSATELASRSDVEAARRALQCGALHDLGQAIHAPLTPARFLRNLLAAPGLTMLRVPASPPDAVAALC